MDLVELLQSRGLRLNAIWRQRMLDEAFAGYGE